MNIAQTTVEPTALGTEVPSEAQAQTENTGVAASLGLNGTLFVFQLINFAIVVAVVWNLILKPLTKKMTERQKLIDESLNNAKIIEENLRRSELKYQERIDQAKVDANKVAERANADAAEAVKAMQQKAQTEIENLVEKAKTHISDERARMLLELKSQTVEVIIEALEKILEEKVTNAKDQELIQGLVSKLR